jgi:protein-disulfide isomerase
LIIGGVLLVAIIGGLALWSGGSSKGNSNGTKTPSNGQTNSSKEKMIPANAPAGANPPNYAGSPTATVTLEEFADFQCPTCAAKHPVMNEIKSIYGTRIYFIYRDFPLDIPAHDKSYDASVAAEAAGFQGKFWDMQNLLFSNQQAWTSAPTYKEMWKGYATKLGLDVAKWENDMLGIQAKSRVDEDKKRGKAIGVNSTPTLFINGVNVDVSDMTTEGLRKLIDAELQKTAPQSKQTNAAAASNATNTGK